MRATSVWVASDSGAGSNTLRMFMPHSLRRLANPECISAAIDRAIARAAGSVGQKRILPVASFRCSMIASESHTTVSPSHRIGTLPDDGATSSRARRSTHSPS